MRNCRLSLACMAFVLMLSLSVEIFACACCSTEAEYVNYKGELSEYELGELKKMRFAPVADLFMTEAGEDVIQGLGTIPANPKPNDYSTPSYSILNSYPDNQLKLDFRDVNKKTGTLFLPIPREMVSFKADIHDGKLSPGGGPLLYKEWRIEGTLRGTGFFQPGFIKPAKYSLVIQGRGNGCDNAEDFTHWRLSVKGENADFAFYGKLNTKTNVVKKGKPAKK